MKAVRCALIAILAGAVACRETTAPPRPSAIVIVTAPPASSQAGTTLPAVTVAVKDDKGNVMSGQPLTVTVSGGGTLEGAPARTQGNATSVGTWTLAPKVGVNTLTITSASLPPLTVTVQGIAGPPAKLTAVSLPATSTVGRTISLQVAALDAFDNAAAGATVQLVATGGGSLGSTSAVTDATGNATVQWTLGTLRGTNTLTASIGAVTAKFSTVAQADAPAAIQIVDGDGQTADAGAALPVQTRVIVLDRFGNATPRQNVSFTVTAGGGSLTGTTTVVSDTNGVVLGPTWVLGKRNVPQQLSVTAGAITRTLGASVRTNFSLILRFIGTTTEAQKAIFQGAASRVTAAITRGGPPANASAFPLAAACGLTGMSPLTEVIDGIVIYAGIGPIDGPGKILAQAGPCAFRSAAFSYMPAIATILFDEADLETLAAGGSLEDVATHEMFHALGYGTLWSTLPLMTGSVNVDPRYVGVNGKAGCAMIATPITCGTSIPVENTGGPGTAGGHWRESVFTNELLTGYLNPGVNPLSAMSISSMIDLGYTVSLTAADPFSVAAGLRAPMSLQSPAVPWEDVRLPASPYELEPVGSLLMRSRRSP